MRPFRLGFAAVILFAAVLAPTATSAAPRFLMPPKAAQGQLVTIQAVIKTGTRCFLVIRYADGAAESPGGTVARSGRASWRFRVAPTAALGTATATVQCGKSGKTSHSFSVVGPILKLKILVDKQGFSQRPGLFGGGSNVSYGIVLSNPSAQQDALDTFVLVNFVDATNRVLGSTSTTVGLVGAGTKYALGDSMGLRTAEPVARLEITLQTRSVQPKHLTPAPALQRVAILPGSFEPGFVGEVDGEMVNDHPTMTLGMTRFSVVLFDGGGQVVGGGTGMSMSDVPPGARLVFTAQSGFSSIPISRAASVLISLNASYKTT
jgi:hypothetical protein